jgi:ferredoxin-NADP reductase
LPPRYTTVVLCAGGIGVTPLCAIWSDIAKKHSVGATKKVVLVWTAPTAKLFAAFQEFLDLAAGCTTGVAFELKGYATRETEEEGAAAAVKGMQVQYGKRPDWEEEIAGAVGGGHTGVFACGPDGLMSEVTRAVGKARGKGGGAVADEGGRGGGKVHLHKETFEW